MSFVILLVVDELAVLSDVDGRICKSSVVERRCRIGIRVATGASNLDVSVDVFDVEPGGNIFLSVTDDPWCNPERSSVSSMPSSSLCISWEGLGRFCICCGEGL